MQVFSLLKYWKGTTAPTPQNDAHDGPFFDLELALQHSQDDANQTQNDNSASDSDSDSDLKLSPSHDLIFLDDPSQPKPHVKASLLKSATKFRVFMLGLKKPKPHDAEDKPTENVPSASEEKRFMRNYFKMVKPLYVRVSRRYAPEAPNGNTHKHLGKARSPPSPPPLLTSKRRDDSLLHQHDWIQGAILHCKNSFNASTECESSELPRSVSDTSPEKCRNDKCI